MLIRVPEISQSLEIVLKNSLYSQSTIVRVFAIEFLPPYAPPALSLSDDKYLTVPSFTYSDIPTCKLFKGSELKAEYLLIPCALRESINVPRRKGLVDSKMFSNVC